MKELSIERMENTNGQGNARCFFSSAYYVFEHAALGSIAINSTALWYACRNS